MIMAEAFASMDIAWILAFIFLRSRNTRERFSERFRQVAAGSLLNADDDCKEVGLRNRNMLVQTIAGLSQWEADGLRLDDAAELALEGLGRFVGDHSNAVQEWQAGLDAAHDDVDRVR